jgi:hypothetical protein
MKRVGLVGLVVACSAPVSDDPFIGGGGALLGATTETGDTSDTGRSEVQSACQSGEDGVLEVLTGKSLTSEVVWTLSFDEDAEANGFTDCSYARLYSGQSRADVPWLCSECDEIFEGTATMTEGVDCYSQIVSEPEETRTEMWGVSGDGLYRSGASQAPMGALTTFEVTESDGLWTAAVEWSSDYELTDGGNMNLSASGEVSWAEDSSHQFDDPWGPRAEPYACEWECNDPGSLELDYDLELGDTLPNARLEDVCGEKVDLWDFAGSYLVLDSSQSDCGPCRSMAEQEQEFIDQMRAAGIPVRVITLLGNGLADPYGTPDQETLDSWVETYALTEPVLKDRGYAYALFPEFLSDEFDEDFGFPAWIVVSPEMKLLHGNVGFSSWEAAVEIIEADYSRR